MTQANQNVPSFDLRDARTFFLNKDLAYALSYEYTAELVGPISVPGGVRLSVRCKDVQERAVFDVLDRDRVPGLDREGHDVPKDFSIVGQDDGLVLRLDPDQRGAIESSIGTMTGRMIFREPKPRHGANPAADRGGRHLSVSYDGRLHLERAVPAASIGEPIAGKAFVTVFFETTEPSFHWLTEQTCIGFGTWELRPRVVAGRAAGVQGPPVKEVFASFDVYCAA